MDTYVTLRALPVRPVRLVALAALALATGPALAQKAPPQTPLPVETATPPAVSAAFADAYAACIGAAFNMETAGENLRAAGWTVDDPFPEGPFSLTVSASKMDDINGDVYFYAIVEGYPTVGLVYCTYEIEGVVGEVDFTTTPAELGLAGGIEVTEGGVFGAWELLNDDGGVLILAQQEGEYFYFQVNVVVTIGDPSAPPLPSAAVPPPPRK